MLWIRFFLLAVYATMYVRDHTRPDAASRRWAWTPTEYDYKVFGITTEISKQVFPISLDIDHPAFRAGMDRLFAAVAAHGRGQGARRPDRQAAAGRAVPWPASAAFARLYLLPVQAPRRCRAQVRVAPAW